MVSVLYAVWHAQGRDLRILPVDLKGERGSGGSDAIELRRGRLQALIQCSKGHLNGASELELQVALTLAAWQIVLLNRGPLRRRSGDGTRLSRTC